MPTLDEVADYPEKASALTAEERARLLLRCASLLVALSTPAAPSGADPADDPLLR